jgi:tRNA pseudouridine32 synthase/23S rRNA pseudouridine746 synthase
MARYRPNAPATQQGVSPSCVVLPLGPWATVLDFLVQRFANVPAQEWQQRLQNGAVLDDDGKPITAQSAYTAGQRIYYYRAVNAEPPIPFEEVVLWQDAHLLVVDKPHFLPVLPSGNYLQETVLVRLKNKLGLPHLTPIHRIDRDTAGLVLFSTDPATRNAYHALFRERQVHKSYEAIARWAPTLPWPVVRKSRLTPAAHFMQQVEVDGPPNTETHIAPLEHFGSWARYALQPVTGHRHQLRVHMAALGLPLLGDGIYPTLTPEGQVDYARPLQLLAKRIAFTDPITGEQRAFESQRPLRSLQDIAQEELNPSHEHATA